MLDLMEKLADLLEEYEAYIDLADHSPYPSLSISMWPKSGLDTEVFDNGLDADELRKRIREQREDGT